MNSVTIFTRNDAALTASVTEQAQAMIAEALRGSALIGKVDNAQENELASKCQGDIAALIRAIDKARLAVTQPYRDAQSSVNRMAEEVTAELKSELTRLQKIVGDFHALELAKVRAAEALRIQKLQDVERERQAALAQAKSHQELEQIQADHCAKQAEIQAKTAVAPVKAAGQVVKPDWNIEVTNPGALFLRYPQCVKLTPLVSEIKALLAAGVKPETLSACGVTVTEVVRTHTRQSKPSTEI